MTHRAILLSVFIVGVSASGLLAQGIPGRVDLDDVTGRSSFPQFVVTGVSFVDSGIQCMEDHGTVRISGRTLRYLRILPTTKLPRDDHSSSFDPWSNSTTLANDETYVNRYLALHCRVRIDIAVRQQVRRRDGTWSSLLVPKETLIVQPLLKYEPPISLQHRDRAPQSAETSSVQNPPTPTHKKKENPLRAANIPATSGWGFTFDSSPETCVEAVGEFRVDQTGLQFTFFTPLPGELNRFEIERTDLDADHGRLAFRRGDCRWEMTVGLSLLRGGKWLAVPLAST